MSNHIPSFYHETKGSVEGGKEEPTSSCCWSAAVLRGQWLSRKEFTGVIVAWGHRLVLRPAIPKARRWGREVSA